jgi:protein DJ-1
LSQSFRWLVIQGNYSSTIAFDTLIRAGVSVTSAFVSPESKGDAEASVAICSRGLKIVPDIGLSPSGFGPDKYDAIVIPGGAKGAETMSNNTIVQNLVKEYFEKEKTIGMICAGRLICRAYIKLCLHSFNLLGSLAAKSSGLPKQPLTSHPSVKEELEKGTLFCTQVAPSADCLYQRFRIQRGVGCYIKESYHEPWTR